MVIVVACALILTTILAHLHTHKIPSSFWAFLLSLYYREIHFTGKIPGDDIATIVVANHPNAFIDPFALQVALGRSLTRTIRADWLNHWLVKWLVKGIGAVPLARFQKDPNQQNRQSFRQLNEALSNGKWVVIFPEGISHNRSKLYPFKKGAAHIADQYTRTTGRPVRVLQAGIFYSDKSRLGSDIWVQCASETIYQPETGLSDIAAETDQWRHNIQQALPGMLRTQEKKKLTRINQHLTSLYPEGTSWLTDAKTWKENAQVNQLLSWLQVSGIDLHVILRHHSSLTLTTRLLADVLVLIAGLPLALGGLVLNSLCALIHYLVVRQQSHAEDKWASNAYVIGIPLYPTFWIAISLLFNPWLGVIAAFSGIYSLYYWRNWSARRHAMFTAFSCLAQPNTQNTVIQLAHQALTPLVTEAKTPSAALNLVRA